MEKIRTNVAFGCYNIVRKTFPSDTLKKLEPVFDELKHEFSTASKGVKVTVQGVGNDEMSFFAYKKGFLGKIKAITKIALSVAEKFPEGRFPQNLRYVDVSKPDKNEILSNFKAAAKSLKRK